MTINAKRSGLNRAHPLNPKPQPARIPSPGEEEHAGYAPAYFHEGRAITILLLGLLYLLLAFSLDAAGWVQNMTLLVPIVLGALTLGTLMAFSRFDGFFMLSHSLSTGLAWVFFLMTRLVDEEPRVAVFIETGVPDLQARAYFLLERWLAWVQAALSGSASNDNYVFILEISFLIWWLAYLGAWTVFRHGYVWRGVVLAGVAILVNTYYAPQPVTGLLVTFCIVALILLAWINLIAHQQRWRVLHIRFNQDIAFDYMRNGVLYAVAVISLAFVSPNLGRSAQFHQWPYPINQRWEAATTEWNRLYQGINRQTRPVQTAFGRSLTLGGERNVTSRPVLQVVAPEGRYWRAVAFDTFTGRQWLNTATAEVEYRANERIATVDWAERRPLTQTITPLSAASIVIFGAPDIRQASVPIEGLLTPIFSPASEEADSDGSELTWTRSQATVEEGESYTVISNYTEVTERALRAAETDYPPQITERYLQLPEDFSSRVAALAAEVTENESTVYDKAKALERHLREYKYNDQIEAPDADQDPVEYFLFEIQEGYCDYYATAMAMMLRSLGIPARTASGYAEGTFDQESGSFIITERDAHTWVEVYFPGYGWIEFEPTAGESVLNRPSGAELPESSSIPGMPEGYTGGDDPLLDDPYYQDQLGRMDELEPGFFEAMNQQSRNNWIWVSVSLTVVALLGGGWLLRRRLYQGPDDFEAEPPNLFYGRLLAWAGRLEMLLQPGQTPYERARFLAQQVPTGGPFIQRITDIYVHHRFAPRRSANVHETELAQNWQRLRPILWRVWIQQRLRSLHLIR